VSGSLNSVTIIGNLMKAPDIRNTQDGNLIANMVVVTSESWKDKATGERKEKAEFHRVVVFGKTAEFIQKYLHKGSKVCVLGKLQTRKWDKDGQDVYTTEIVIQGYSGQVVFLDKKSDSNEGGSNNDATNSFIASQKEKASIDDDLGIPF